MGVEGRQVGVRKSSQWVTLTRMHAEIVGTEEHLWPLVSKWCRIKVCDGTSSCLGWLIPRHCIPYCTDTKYRIFVPELLLVLGIVFRTVGMLPEYSGAEYLQPVPYNTRLEKSWMGEHMVHISLPPLY